MSGKAILIFLAGIIGISATVFTNLFRYSGMSADNLSRTYYFQSASNIAQSGANLALRQLAEDPAWRTGFTDKPMLGGKCTVTVTDINYKGNPAIKITSAGLTDYSAEGFASNSPKITDTTVCYIIKGFIPAAVKAAITANNNVETKGNLQVDGRDHRSDGTLLTSSKVLNITGTLAVWTTKDLDQGGSSDLGGTSSWTDYAPSRPGSPLVYKTYQTWPGGYPSTPDGILGGESAGYTEGTLKSIAKSKSGGSQYVTNPAALSLPLKGVTYVELESDETWQSMNLTGSGILIVHNAACDAKIKNLNSGTFTGLLIADDIVHVHNNIVGAVICLTQNPSEGNCIGNGSGTVKYSSEAVLNATGAAFRISPGKSSQSKVTVWLE
ncbi:MAG: hypothetical protein ACM34K_06590 [Bacillota bacterium]